MAQDYRRSRHSVHMLHYHFVWIPKRRKLVLVGDVSRRMKHLIYDIAKEIDCDVLAMEVMPDHVHLFVSAHPSWAPNQIVRKFKGVTARILRQEFPHLCKLPSLWTRSYFVGTAGNVSNETIKRYIAEQTHH